MFGLILNSFIKVNKQIDELISKVYPAKRHFGINITTNKTVESGTTVLGSELGGSEFKNLTVEDNANIVSDVYFTGDAHSVIKPGNYAPLIIRCSDTLTVNGTINADGKGLHDVYTTQTAVPFYTQLWNEAVTAPGYSVTYGTYQYLLKYAAGMPFFIADHFKSSSDYTGFFFGTGGSNGLNGFKVGYNISSGGKYNSVAGGGSGGLVILYYEHLYAIDIYGVRTEYGVDENFPVNRICANGLGGNCGSTSTYGGGCIILAARNIVLGPNGRISANGTLADGVTQTGANFGFFNNLPQLGLNQTGVYWNGTTYAYGVPATRTYYFTDGLEINSCNKSTTDYGLDSGDATYCGGAGAALGIKCII